MATVLTRTNRDHQDVGGSCGIASRNAHIPDRVGIPGVALPCFDLLSNEAKLLFIIGEPLRLDQTLSSDRWINRVAFEWVRITQKNVKDFESAWDEVAEWARKSKAINTKQKD